jgi:hypothetical protein
MPTAERRFSGNAIHGRLGTISAEKIVDAKDRRGARLFPETLLATADKAIQ